MDITEETIHLLSSPEVQEFVRQNERSDEKSLILRNKMIQGIPSSLIADQIQCRRKAREKLPLWFNTSGIIYPPSKNLEQCSSERTANYKAEILGGLSSLRKPLVADLTGGFGVDAYFLSTVYSEVHYVEPDAGLASIARHNHSLLGARNIRHHTITAEKFLEQATGKFDLVFIDPSRRNETRRVFRLSECEPNVVSLRERIFSKSPYFLIKVSPLLDIRKGMTELENVEQVHIVSVDNECKEVLFLCKEGYADEAQISTVNLISNTRQQFSFQLTAEQRTVVAYSEPLEFIYEPNASILKAGAFKLIGTAYGLKKIHPNTHLYTSEKITQGFPGRIFRTVQHVKPEAGLFAKIFPDGHANVITRNYPLSADQLKKKTRLKDGGNNYVIAFTSAEGKVVIVAERVA